MKLVYPTRNAHTPASPPASTSSFLLPPPSYPRVLHTLHHSPTIKAFDMFLHVLFFRCSKSVPPSSTPSPPLSHACSCLVPVSHQSKSSFSLAYFFHSVLLFSNNILVIVPAAAYSATRGFFFLLRLTCFDLISSIFFSCTHTYTYACRQRHIHPHRYTSSLEERFPSSPTRPLTFTLLPIPIFPLPFHFPCSPAAPSLPCSISPSSRTSASSSIGNFYHAYTPVLLYRSSLFASLTSRSYHIVSSTSSPIPCYLPLSFSIGGTIDLRTPRGDHLFRNGLLIR